MVNLVCCSNLLVVIVFICMLQVDAQSKLSCKLANCSEMHAELKCMVHVNGNKVVT